MNSVENVNVMALSAGVVIRGVPDTECHIKLSLSLSLSLFISLSFFFYYYFTIPCWVCDRFIDSFPDTLTSE